MLFLAVFCSFLAEWELERVIEHHREKEFMASMLTDLKADTTNLSRMHKTFSIVRANIDSLIPLLEAPDSMSARATDIYRHQVVLTLYTKWIYSDRTIEQLKNSGNFRLIRNKVVSDGIMDYDGFIRNYIGDMEDQFIERQWTNVTEGGIDIFKASVVRRSFKGFGNHHPDIQLPPPPYFISTDKQRIERFTNLLDYYILSLDWFEMNISKAKQKAVSLDSLIRKEYEVEEEN